jgi:polycomb protein EED
LLTITTQFGHSSTQSSAADDGDQHRPNGSAVKTEPADDEESRASDRLDDDSGDACSETTETSQQSGSSQTRRRSRTGGKKKKQQQPVAGKKRFSYKYVSHAKELHNQPLFGVAFNPHLQVTHRHVFAVCGSNKISIYEAMPDGTLKIHQSFSDPDKDESFYCCCWSYDDSVRSDQVTQNGHPVPLLLALPGPSGRTPAAPSEKYNVLLIAAGSKGIIRIINPVTQQYKFLKGHGLSINDLQIHPYDHNILMSVSKDHSVRLWNIRTLVCVAIFGGVEGHRDEVLSCDFHRMGKKIITCGMDHSLKIWSLESPDVIAAVQESYKFDHVKSEKPFSTARVHFASFTTRDIHRNYVDCVSWFGDFVLSKSCENAIIMWKAGKIDADLDTFLPGDKYVTDATSTFIHQFDLKDSEIWFMRFSMDEDQKTMALGNMNGRTYVWDVDADDFDHYKLIVLQHPKLSSAVRQTALSNDGSILICVADDSTIWRWEREHAA